MNLLFQEGQEENQKNMNSIMNIAFYMDILKILMQFVILIYQKGNHSLLSAMISLVTLEILKNMIIYRRVLHPLKSADVSKMNEENERKQEKIGEKERTNLKIA